MPSPSHPLEGTVEEVGTSGTAAGDWSSSGPTWLFGGFAATILVDQITKFVATRILAGGPIDLEIIRLRLVANRGILMGIPAPTIVVLGAAAGLLVALRGSKGATLAMSLGYGLIAGGAMGNLVDRFVERGAFPPHAVVDWISLGHVTFNIADAMILFGLLIVGHDAHSSAVRPSDPSQDGARILPNGGGGIPHPMSITPTERKRP